MMPQDGWFSQHAPTPSSGNWFVKNAPGPQPPREAAIGRELTLGALGTVLPETENPLKSLAEAAKPDLASGWTYVDPGGIGRAAFGMGKQLIKGAGEAAPVLSKYTPGGGMGAGVTPEEKEQLAHGAGTLAGSALQLLGLKKGVTKGITPEQSSARNFLSLGKRIAKGSVARPRTVEYDWAKGSLEILKKARQQDYAAKTSAYPKINAEFPITEAANVLPEKHPFAGIRAAREKLDLGGATEKGIRDARSELWTYRKRTGLPTDEFKAYNDAYAKLTEQLRKPYEQAGKLDEFLAAEKGFAQYMETFHGKQSPIAQALQSELKASGFVEPSKVFRKFGSEVARKQVESLGGLGLDPGELFRMRQIGKFSDPAFSSGIAFTLKIPLIRQALEYLLTRPVGIKALDPVPAHGPALVKSPKPKGTP